MTFLIQQTLIYAVPLMIVALAGVFAERSGIINLALEGIMVFGAFIGVWFVRILQTSDAILSLKQSGNWSHFRAWSFSRSWSRRPSARWRSQRPPAC